MPDVANYQLQFFRQWLGDAQIEDLLVAGPLDQAKALARTSLARLAADSAVRPRPRIARIVDADRHAVIAEFRFTDGGPIEIRSHSTDESR